MPNPASQTESEPPYLSIQLHFLDVSPPLTVGTVCTVNGLTEHTLYSIRYLILHATKKRPIV